MLGMVKALVPQLAQMNVRINGLAPGVIETKFSEAVSNHMGLHTGKPVFGKNKGADQPAHPHSLISAFVIHLFES